VTSIIAEFQSWTFIAFHTSAGIEVLSANIESSLQYSTATLCASIFEAFSSASGKLLTKLSAFNETYFNKPMQFIKVSLKALDLIPRPSNLINNL
tara:strand:- start:974 stop:1258 length:285 start_codon:yes stop_codon:yes gene_type:complete